MITSKFIGSSRDISGGFSFKSAKSESIKNLNL